jgi:hypothetical protein
LNNAWFLESVATDGSRLIRPIDRLPFRVGREAGNDLTVDALGLSSTSATPSTGSAPTAPRAWPCARPQATTAAR